MIGTGSLCNLGEIVVILQLVQVHAVGRDLVFNCNLSASRYVLVFHSELLFIGTVSRYAAVGCANFILRHR